MKFWTDIFVKVVQSQKPSKSALDGPLPFYSRVIRRVDSCSQKLCQHVIIILRHSKKPTPVLQATPSLLTYFTEPRKTA